MEKVSTLATLPVLCVRGAAQGQSRRESCFSCICVHIYVCEYRCILVYEYRFIESVQYENKYENKYVCIYMYTYLEGYLDGHILRHL